MALFEQGRHEPLRGDAWDEASARRAIEAIVRDCETRFTPEGLWPAHPLDTEGRSREPYCLLYRGAVGVILALDLLARRGPYGLRRYSLYAGDPGLAIYLAACIDGSDGWPSLDPEPGPQASAGL